MRNGHLFERKAIGIMQVSEKKYSLSRTGEKESEGQRLNFRCQYGGNTYKLSMDLTYIMLPHFLEDKAEH